MGQDEALLPEAHWKAEAQPVQLHKLSHEEGFSDRSMPAIFPPPGTRKANHTVSLTYLLESFFSYSHRRNRMRERQKIGAAVIGLGNFGQLHARAYNENPKSKLVAICDSDARKLNAASKKLGIRARRRFTDHMEMLKDLDDEIDVVSIVTPDALHSEMALEAARRGKHILLEKPMCLTLDEADRIIEAVRKYKIRLMVDFILRFDPRYLKARENLSRGEIGEIATLFARRHGVIQFARTHGKFSDLFLSTAIHDIDLMLWFACLKPTTVYAEGTRQILRSKTVDDAIFGILKFPNGIIGSIDANWTLPESSPSPLESEFRVVGSRGVINVASQNQGLWQIANKNGLKVPDITFWPVVEDKLLGDLKTAVDHFVTIVAENKQPLVGPVEGKNALRVALGLKESASKHQVLNLSW
jgi:predicted dehydrogenase